MKQQNMGVENSPAKISATQSVNARLLSDLNDTLNVKLEPVSEFEYAEVFIRSILTGELSPQDSLRLGNAGPVGHITLPLPIEPQRLAYYRESLAHLVRLNDSEHSDSKREVSQQHVIEARVVSAERINRRIATVPRIHWLKNEPTLSHAIVGADIQACLDYAFSLVLFKWRNQLHQCHLDSCRTFWLCKAGDKRRRFCSQKHRVDFGNADAKYRKQAAKFDMKVPEWREIRQIDPTMTAPKWQAILAAASPLTAEHWITGQKRTPK
jgi:hypothetical protein